MTTVRCWLCGHEVELSSINLMASYERYLVLTFVLSLLLRFRQYHTNVRFAWAFPQQWPNVLEVIKKHSSIFLRWTTLLPVAVTLGILLTHTVCYRLIWQEAVVTPHGLQQHPVVMAFLFPVSLWMICLDLTTLFRASQLDFAEIEKNLSKGEFALTSRAVGPSAGLFGILQSPEVGRESRGRFLARRSACLARTTAEVVVSHGRADRVWLSALVRLWPPDGTHRASGVSRLCWDPGALVGCNVLVESKGTRHPAQYWSDLNTTDCRGSSPGPSESRWCECCDESFMPKRVVVTHRFEDVRTKS